MMEKELPLCAEKPLQRMLEHYPELRVVEQDIAAAYQMMAASYAAGGKMLLAGNGGSAADAEHIVGELMKGFRRKRTVDARFAQALMEQDAELGAVLAQHLQGALPAMTLDGHIALSTAYLNDCDPLLCFAQQVNGFGKAGDVFWAISTSGKSKNILYAAVTARAKGLKVVGLTGNAQSPLYSLCDVCICAPAKETYQVQELHLPIYHCLCMMLEETFFGDKE